jgi:hypothetical protein
VTYHIEVEREAEGNQVSLVVDGKSISGNIIPVPANGKSVVKVKATLGSAVAVAGTH